jgi:predicted ATPase
LNFENGSGQVISGEMPDDKSEERIEEKLNSPEMLAVSALGQLARHPRVAALRKFITSWYLSYITADNTRTTPDEGPQEQLSKTGDNLPNVIQYFQEGHLNILGKIFSILSERVPKLERVESVPMPDGRLLLQFKDYPFDKPILSKFTSDGTLKMLAYLTVLYNPDPPQLIGIEEPENQIHPKLLSDLAEECKEATAKTQIFISTHSPYFVDAVKPKELWVLDRDDNGYTIAKKVSDMQGIIQFYEKGSSTGQLWMENFFELGDPFKSSKR